MRDLYWKDNLSLVEIGKKFKTNHKTITRYFKMHNIPTRNLKDAKALRNTLGKDKIYKINENFFSEYSDEMAYVLGWIASDGNLHKDVNSIKIFTNDKEILENIKQIMKSGHTIHTRKRSNIEWKTGYCLSICNKNLYNDLLKIGITPNKSKTLKFPQIPKKYLRHFVRGVFEGDGSVGAYKNQNKTNKIITTTFCCSSQKFLNKLSKILSIEIGLTEKKIHYIKIVYSLEESLKLFHYMYDNVPENMILKRKYDKFYNYFSERGMI